VLFVVGADSSVSAGRGFNSSVQEADYLSVIRESLVDRRHVACANPPQKTPQRTLEAAILSMQGLSHHWPLRLARSLADRPVGVPGGVPEPVFLVASPFRPIKTARTKKKSLQLRGSLYAIGSQM
jgi:hypothetical protein